MYPEKLNVYIFCHFGWVPWNEMTCFAERETNEQDKLPSLREYHVLPTFLSGVSSKIVWFFREEKGKNRHDSCIGMENEKGSSLPAVSVQYIRRVLDADAVLLFQMEEEYHYRTLFWSCCCFDKVFNFILPHLIPEFKNLFFRFRSSCCAVFSRHRDWYLILVAKYKRKQHMSLPTSNLKSSKGWSNEIYLTMKLNSFESSTCYPETGWLCNAEVGAIYLL